MKLFNPHLVNSLHSKLLGARIHHFYLPQSVMHTDCIIQIFYNNRLFSVENLYQSTTRSEILFIATRQLIYAETVTFSFPPPPTPNIRSCQGRKNKKYQSIYKKPLIQQNNEYNNAELSSRLRVTYSN